MENIPGNPFQRDPVTTKEPPLRLPAIATGIFFSILVCIFTPYNNIKLQNSPLAGGHFPLAAFAAVLLLLAVANPLLSVFNRKWRLNSREVLLIWSMTAVSSGLAYTGLMRTFILNITTPGWLNTFEDIGKEISPYAPSSLLPGGPDFIRTLYNGLDGGLEMGWIDILSRIPWHAWFAPFLLWALFLFLVYSASLGVVGLFSHQWLENEKMNFPLVQVPVTLSKAADVEDALSAFFRNKYFLVGLWIPILLHGFNGLHTYYPEIPELPTVLLAQPYIPREGILAGLYKMKIYIIPAFIGFAFLASKQISFSFWFFFLLGGIFPGLLGTLGWKIPSASIGTVFGPTLTRVEEMQTIGAVTVFFLFIVWLARYHLLAVFRSLLGKKTDNGQFHGLLSPQVSVFLFSGGLVGAGIWLSFFGMDFWSAVIFLAVCFISQLVASRVICQGGIPYFTLVLAPSDGFLSFFGTHSLQASTLFLGAVVQKIAFVDFRESLIPFLFQSSKLSDGSHPRRRFLWGIVLAMICGVLVTFVAMLALYYKFGISGLPDSWAVESTRKVHESAAFLIKHPEDVNQWAIIFSIVGGAFMLFLVMGYHLFVWWPLHPIGYLTTYGSAMQILWFGFFIGWLCNSLVLRYGGVKLYAEVKRLFIGLVVGDMVMAIFWLVVGIFAPVSYHVLPL
jgi:hypothetical protein